MRWIDARRLRPMAAALAARRATRCRLRCGAGRRIGVAAYRWREIREPAGFGLEAIGEAARAIARFAALGDRTGVRQHSDPSGQMAGPATPMVARRRTPARPRSTRVWFAGPSGLLAVFSVAEAMRADAPATVDALRRDGLALALLSGDDAGRVRRLADRLSIDVAQGGATPADKLAFVESLQRRGHRVGMVGDGLNDAPVMALGFPRDREGAS